MHKTLHRLLLLVVALATGAISLIAVAPSAHAATYPTITTIGANKSVVLHGSTVKITGCGTVAEASTACAPFGKLTLQRKLIGGSWKNVASRNATLANPRATWALTPSASASYRVAWTGGPYGGDTYAPTPATKRKVKAIRVARNLHDTFSRSSFTFSGRVTPTYAGKTVYIQRTTCSNPQARSCTWNLHKTLRSTSVSRWKVRLPAYARTTYFRAYIKASSGFAPSYSNYYIETKRYRPANSRLVR